MSDIKLKPCPFCGGMPHMYGMKRREYVDGVWAEEEGEEYWVKPFCSITCILGNAHDKAYGILDGLKYTTPEAAANAWNKRDTTEHMQHYKQGLADAVARAKGELMQAFDPDREVGMMEKMDEQFKKDLEYMLRLLKRVEFLEKKAKDQLETIDSLTKENARLLYEYEDSKLQRDTPLPYKWRYDGKRTYQFCPKCEMMISNWQSYCHACGQKIGKGNPLPEMEIKNE